MSDLLSSPIPMLIVLVAIFYFLIIRPQQQQTKKLRAAVEALRRGDTVLTSAGILGKVSKIPQKDDPEVTVEIADGVLVKMVKSAIVEVRAKSQPANDTK
jgi:preprotein translocase subunit YajC